MKDHKRVIDFDESIDRVGTFCSKWDDMQTYYGIDPAEGLPMWVADADFRPPASVQQAVQDLADQGVYGYPGQNRPYLQAIQWWMAQRHQWQIQTDWVITTAGLVNATALSIDTFTQPGDHVILMTPVYHEFAKAIRANDRVVTEFPLRQNEDGQYQMDWDEWSGRLTGREKMLILCSPHNPGGRVWSAQELRAVADFCIAHDLILVSDEVHHDLVMPDAPRHLVMAALAPDIEDRLITLSAASKTFNIAGFRVGNAIIADPKLRAAFVARQAALGLSQRLYGMNMVAAAYSPEGADWADQLVAYLDGNRRLFDAGAHEIPGLRSMPLQATYLAWVDFSGTGMSRDEFTARVQQNASIAVSPGAAFGTGGESFLRFNLATTRAKVAEAVERLQKAFSDLQ